MIDDRELRRLADADPARHLDPAPDADLLEHILARPRPRRRPAARRRRLLTPVLALTVAVVGAGVAVLVSPSAPTRLSPVDLAAQAYAKTGAAPDQIVHTIATTERVEASANGTIRDGGTLEEWHRGGETHRLERFSKRGKAGLATDHLIDADGVMRQVTDDGSYRVIRKGDSDGSVIAQEQSGFVEDFRQRYEQGALDPAGDVQFAGRPARRYVVKLTDGARPGPEQAFYIDRETAEPLGYTSTLTEDIADGTGGSTPTTMRFVQTVKTIERLEPTPENLRKLTTFSLPRR